MMHVRWNPFFFILALIAVLTVVLTAGCQSTPSASATASTATDAAPATATTKDKPTYSGFLGDYSQLQPAPDREGMMAYIDRSADYRRYTKVMFDPTQFYVIPNPEYPEVPRDELVRMGDSLLSAFKKALEPGYQVVSAPGPDVLRVRMAITGIQPAKPSAGVTDYIPIKALFNVGREVAGAGPRTAEMAAEMEVLDPSGKRLAAATATRKGDKHLAQGAQITWKDLQSINDYWAKSFRQRLDELRGTRQPG